MALSPVLQRVEKALHGAGLLDPPGQTLVVGVSGGPDSLALLLLLEAVTGEHPLRLHVAHLDHGLRGEEGQKDARFVQATCQCLGIPVTVERADVAAMRARLRLSWEEAAREARYSFLAGVARRQSASAVAVGHTTDDQAETVLLHLLRGAGLRGLCGMAPLSRWRSRDGSQQVAVVRPLLNVTRQETEALCQAQGLAPRLDSSNLEERFTRNRLRRQLMPLLRTYNPAIRDALVRLARTAAQDLAYLDARVQEAWRSLVTREPWGLRMQRAGFLALHPALQAHLLQRAYQELAGEGVELTYAQVEAMRDLAAAGAGRSHSLGGGLRWLTSYDELLLTRVAPSSPWPPLQETSLPPHGQQSVQGWHIVLQEMPAAGAPQEGPSDDPYRAFLDRDALGGRLWVRGRRPGDRFQPLGMEGTKRLKEFMADAHVPRVWREAVPLLVGERGVAWVVGWRIAHWARVTPDTRAVLRITFRQVET